MNHSQFPSFFQVLISVLVLALCVAAYSFRCQLQSVQKSQQSLTSTVKAMQVQVDSLLREQEDGKNAYTELQESMGVKLWKQTHFISNRT